MSTDVLWNLDNRNKNLKINLVLKNGLCMVQTIVHAWCSVAFLCLNRNVHFFFLPGDRCCIILKMDLGTAEEISVFVVSEYLGCVPCITNVGRLGHLRKKGGTEGYYCTLNRLLSLLRQKWYRQFITFRHARTKWNIDRQFHGRLIQQLPAESWRWLFPGEQTDVLMFI